jgi:RND family efflux transporter MFP subunit
MQPFFSLATVLAVAFCLCCCGCKDSKLSAAAAAVSPAEEKPAPNQPARQADTPVQPALPKGSWQPVKRETVRQFTPAIGNFYPRQVTKVGPMVSGHTEKILVDVGDMVKKGQPLVLLDTASFEIEVAQRKTDVKLAEARVASIGQRMKTIEIEISQAQISLDEANLQLKRMENLWKKPKAEGKPTSVPDKLYDDAVFRQRQAAASLAAANSRLGEARMQESEATCMVDQAKENLRYAEQRLQDATICAHYDAVVSKRLVDVGEPVTSAPVIHILELQEVATLILEFSLPQRMLTLVNEKTPLEFSVDGIPGVTYQARIAVIYPAIDEATRTFRCRTFIPNSDCKLRPGLLAQARVVSMEKENVLVVPLQSLVARGQDSAQVYVMRAGRATLCAVKLGLVTEIQTEITSGLTEGESILLPE